MSDPDQPFQPPSPFSSQAGWAQPPYNSQAPLDTQPAYPAAPPHWQTAPPPPGATSPWMVALVVVSSAALLVGMAALIVGGLVLGQGLAFGGGYGRLGDDYLGGYSDFGDDAAFGDYTQSLEFTGLRSLEGVVAGDCFTVRDIDDDLVGEPSATSCDDPHEYEAYAPETLGGGEYPGYDELYDDLVERCEEEFADYVGVDYYDSFADFGVLAPTERGWSDGERESLCVLYQYQLERSGSLRDGER